jgi:hypothetical protein
MKCMLCGTENQAGANNCKGCGASFTADQTAPSALKGSKTVFEDSNLSQPGIASGKMSGDRAKTRYISPEGSAGSTPGGNMHKINDIKKTRFVDSGSEGLSAVTQSTFGPLSGFLVTFTWDLTGTWFPIREGKNVYGSSNTCDGHIETDRAMSAEHFAIMCRKGELRVRDMESTNATTVDGAEVWSGIATIQHGSIIKAGDTTFVVALVPIIQKG